MFAAPALPLLLAMAGSGLAHAEWNPGQIPEHDTPFTVGRGALRLSLFGRSALGLGERTELSTVLPMDLVLYPNLQLKHRFLDIGPVSAAWKLGLGGGCLPLAGGAVLPTPMPFAVGGVGLLAASTQSAGVDAAVGLGGLSLTARGSLIAAEGAALGVGGGVTVGAVTPAGFATSGRIGLWSAGAELDATVNAHNALFAGGDLYHAIGDPGGGLGEPSGLMVASAGWMHGWRHASLTLGAYGILDLPDAKMAQDAPPIGPMANLAWTFGGGRGQRRG